MPDEQGGWLYQDERLGNLFATSVPQTQDEAIEYAATVKAFFGVQPHYIARRSPGQGRHEMIPYKYDPRVGRFVPIEEALE